MMGEGKDGSGTSIKVGKEIPGVTYGDVMPLFDYVTRLQPRGISFAGTFESY